MTTQPLPTRRSVWTTREKLIRVVWDTLGRLLWALHPAIRPALIRRFGGTVGERCSFARSARLYIPWHLTAGDDVRVGPHAVLYSLGMITLGDGTVLDEHAHLCAGTHDMADPRFPLLKTPITLGARCFVGIDAYVGPNVTLADGCAVWPRASVYKDAPAGTRLVGNPARPARDHAEQVAEARPDAKGEEHAA